MIAARGVLVLSGDNPLQVDASSLRALEVAGDGGRARSIDYGKVPSGERMNPCDTRFAIGQFPTMTPSALIEPGPVPAK